MLSHATWALGYHVPLHAARHQPCTMSASVGSLCTYGDDDSTLLGEAGESWRLFGVVWWAGPDPADRAARGLLEQ